MCHHHQELRKKKFLIKIISKMVYIHHLKNKDVLFARERPWIPSIGVREREKYKSMLSSSARKTGSISSELCGGLSVYFLTVVKEANRFFFSMNLICISNNSTELACASTPSPTGPEDTAERWCLPTGSKYPHSRASQPGSITWDLSIPSLLTPGLWPVL